MIVKPASPIGLYPQPGENGGIVPPWLRKPLPVPPKQEHQEGAS